jgi:hypothetical protein
LKNQWNPKFGRAIEGSSAWNFRKSHAPIMNPGGLHHGEEEEEKEELVIPENGACVSHAGNRPYRRSNAAAKARKNQKGRRLPAFFLLST